ncbi:MAG: hypothetical protein CMJ90_14020 [Planctomycetes bacterium]|nr:hypothetical protein [Planctomycetota bacterium]
MLKIRLLTIVMLALVRVSAQDYKAEYEEIKAATKIRLWFHESDNFVWASGLNAAQTRPCVRAAEKAFSIWKEVSGTATWREMWGRTKCLVLVGKNKSQYRKLLRWYEKKHDPYPGFIQAATPNNYFPNQNKRVAFFMHARPLDIKTLPYVAAHEVGHLCVWRFRWNQYFVPPWLEEGMGLYLEARTFNRTRCYCFGGSYGDASGSSEKLFDIAWSKWKETVRQMVRKRSDKQMKTILRLRHNQIGGPEAGKSWSVIDFMIKKDKKAFTRFMRQLKSYWPQKGGPSPAFTPEKQKAQERALKDGFDWTFDQLDAEWRAWAKKGMKKIE